jgi:demethylmenaquinone methyltransferase/2-methoxy-6-polyprenyl-1,4-benzoquinol methylase
VSFLLNRYKVAKKVVLQIVANRTETILDIATGDLAILMAQTNAEKIIGLDISRMLEVGVKNCRKETFNTIEMILGDSENMPLKILILMQ